MAIVDTSTITVALLDDHEIVRNGVANMVNSQDDMTVVGDAGTARDFLAVIRATEPDVALLDVRLGADDGNGIAVCREIRSSHPDVACLILTSFADDEALVEAALAGAAGFVLKEIRGTELIDSIRKVANGSQLLDTAQQRMAMQRLSQTEAGALAQLTEQERRIFDLIGEGASNRQIGETLSIAEKTVKNHVSQVLAKLGLVRRTEVAALAARLEERTKRRFD